MATIENIIEPKIAQSGHLLRILGVGFGLAVGIGGTIGVGILRNPSGVAAQLGSVWMIMLAWLLGGLYCLLGANYLTELATMIPKAGGFYVYAERAFGRYGGFVVGWSDWLNNTLGLSFISVVFGEYAARLFAPNLRGGRIIFSVSIIVVVAILNLIGVRSGSETQKISSFLKATRIARICRRLFCFRWTDHQADTRKLHSRSEISFIGLGCICTRPFNLCLELTTAGIRQSIFPRKTPTRQPIFPARCSAESRRSSPFICSSISRCYMCCRCQHLAASNFAGGDAMSLIFGVQSGQLVTILALLSLIGIINAILMMAPRIMFALGRDGLFFENAAAVNKGGTPVVALLITTLAAIILSSIGTFELLLAIGQFFIVVITILLIVSLFILRVVNPTCLVRFAPGLIHSRRC